MSVIRQLLVIVLLIVLFPLRAEDSFSLLTQKLINALPSQQPEQSIRICVLDFTDSVTNSQNTISALIHEELETAFSKSTNVELFTRHDLNQLEEEIEFQNHGEVDEDTIINQLQIKGVTSIVRGRHLCLDNQIVIFAEIINIKDAKVLAKERISLIQNGETGRFSPGFYGKEKISDDSTAFLLCMKEAEAGSAQAQCNLGIRYEKGIGIPHDGKEAFKWYREAAIQNHAVAENNLGWCYDAGIGVEKNAQMAAFWYLKSANQGYSIAQCNMGMCYVRGFGVEKSAIQAFKWFLKSAEQGNSDAQYNLGTCYEKGFGTSKNVVRAVRWYTKATDQGNKAARQALQRLENKYSN